MLSMYFVPFEVKRRYLISFETGADRTKIAGKTHVAKSRTMDEDCSVIN